MNRLSSQKSSVSRSMPMQFIEVSLRTERGRDGASWYIAKTEFMRASGSLMKDVAKAWSGMPMETNTKETSRKVKLMARESTTGQTERFMTANGARASRMAMECGRASLVTHTSASGRTARQTATECTSGKMETGMKEPG